MDLNESAKLRALRALVLYVPRASCPTCSRTLRASCLTCSRAPRASCLTCSCAASASCSRVSSASCPKCLVPYVPSCLTCLVPYVLCCLTWLVPYMLSCLRALGVLVSHVPCALLVLGLARTLRALLLLGPHLLQLFQVYASHLF